jgi:lipoprotein NlpI
MQCRWFHPYGDYLYKSSQVIQLEPNSVEGYYRIGIVYLKVDNYDQAKHAFELGLKYDPEDTRCHQALQLIQR